MSVGKADRNESKVEFDNTYFKVYHDAVKLIENKFGAKGEQKDRINYINYMASAIMRI